MSNLKREWQVDKQCYAVYAEQNDGTMEYVRSFFIAVNEYFDESKKMIISPIDEIQEMETFIKNLNSKTRTITLLAYYFNQYKNSKNNLKFDIPVSGDKMFERAKRIYPSYKNLIRK